MTVIEIVLNTGDAIYKNLRNLSIKDIQGKSFWFAEILSSQSFIDLCEMIYKSISSSRHDGFFNCM